MFPIVTIFIKKCNCLLEQLNQFINISYINFKETNLGVFMKPYIPTYGTQDFYQSMLTAYSKNVPPEEQMRIPLFPLYEQEDDELWEQDINYMKQLYPKAVQQIQQEVEDQCDRLEYDGSCMFDQYPDRCHLELLTNQIYNRIMNANNNTIPDTTTSPLSDKKESTNTSSDSIAVSNVSSYPLWSGHCPPNQSCRYDNEPNWLRNLIQIMLYNEMGNRRRRYRNRKRWY